MSPSPCSIERLHAPAWERLRAVRLRALRDAPDAFGSLAEDVGREPGGFWQERLARPTRATFVAVMAGVDVGLACGDRYDDEEDGAHDGAAGLFGMWVAPEARGQGVGEALIEAVIAWARSAGYARMLLDVGDANEPARHLYARMGFVANGGTSTLPAPREHITEHQMELPLWS